MLKRIFNDILCKMHTHRFLVSCMKIRVSKLKQHRTCCHKLSILILICQPIVSTSTSIKIKMSRNQQQKRIGTMLETWLVKKTKNTDEMETDDCKFALLFICDAFVFVFVLKIKVQLFLIFSKSI